MGAALVVGSIAVLALLLLVRRVENSLIFFPARYPVGAWDTSRAGSNVREVSFRAADGVLLSAWWFEALPLAEADGPASGVLTSENPSELRNRQPVDGGGDRHDRATPVLLWAHGNAGNLTGRAPHAQVLAGEGMSVFLFDYRGYGKSEGSPDEEGIYADAEAAYAYLTGELEIAPERIVLLGRSLGSAPAARLATRVPHAATVLVSPLPSARHMARRMFAGLPVDWLARSRFPVVDWVRERSTPLLVIHGDRDDVIPFSFGREVFDAAAEPKQFLPLPRAGHNDILMVGGRDYLDALSAFARSAVEPRR